MNYLILSSARSGTTLLCNLISQCGYENYGEFVSREVSDIVGFFNDHDNVVAKINFQKLRNFSSNNNYKIIRIVRDRLDRITSYVIAKETEVFCINSEIQSYLPDKFVKTQEEYNTAIQNILSDSTKIDSMADFAYNNWLRKAPNRDLLQEKLTEFGVGYTTITYDDLIANPNQVVGEILGKEAQVDLTQVIRQTSELHEALRQKILEKLEN